MTRQSYWKAGVLLILVFAVCNESVPLSHDAKERSNEGNLGLNSLLKRKGKRPDPPQDATLEYTSDGAKFTFGPPETEFDSYVIKVDRDETIVDKMETSAEVTGVDMTVSHMWSLQTRKGEVDSKNAMFTTITDSRPPPTDEE